MKISVIIPAYNVKNFIKRCVDSVLTQEADCDIETIIIDDGSTDGTDNVCDSFVNKPGVKVIHKQNGGLSSARNAGIDISTGDYVMFVDGDDYIVNGAIAYIVDIISVIEEPIDFIQYRYVEVENYNYHAKIPKNLSGIEVITNKYEVFNRKLSLGGIGASACSKVINRSLLNTIRFKEGIIHEDELFTAHLIDNIKYRVVYTDAELYCYVMREGSIIKSNFSSKKLDIIPVFNEQIAILKKNNYEDLASIVTSRYFVNLCLLYENACSVGDRDSAWHIRMAAMQLVKRNNIILSRKFKIIAKTLKFNLPVLQCYYLFKKYRS